MTALNQQTYEDLATVCQPHLLYSDPLPRLPEPGAMPMLSCAVYVAVDERKRPCYVGSVYRPRDEDGLSAHLRQYLQSLQKTVRWGKIYVLPLKPQTSEHDVRRLGGEIAGWLLPYDRQRWPNLE